MELYDSIGHGYGDRRKQDPRIAERIDRALGSAESVLNVGAGAGSYEPTDRKLFALEPSMVMIRQRPPEASPAVCASAMDLPFRDESFDASLAVLTLHHWPDVWRGIEELRRAARKTVVILTFDTSVGGFWLTDYFPEILELDQLAMPAISAIERHLGGAKVFDVPIPHDCTDGLLGAHWQRPHAYLDAGVRSATSVFSQIGNLEPGLARLRADLESGSWDRRHGHLLSHAELDLGYRLVVAELESAASRDDEGPVRYLKESKTLTMRE
jgi:SAM-dependent methyltransferase